MSKIIRQGDCMLVAIKAIPAGCVEVEPKNGRIELLWGESTNHCHAIADWAPPTMDDALQVAKNAIGLAGRRARLLMASNGARYLEVAETVNLTHEEHTSHAIPKGFYEIPQQVEYSVGNMPRRVTD